MPSTTTHGDPVPVYRITAEGTFCVCSPNGPGGRPMIVRGALDDPRVAALIQEYGGAPEADWIDVDVDRIGDLPDDVREAIADALDRLLAFDAAQREGGTAVTA